MIFIVLIGFFFSGCEKEKYLVVYTSVDEVYSSKIFKEFEKETGIKIKPVYDVESAKAVGLEKRLLLEKNHPQADIFWNSEPLRTARLAKQGIFQPYPEFNVSLYRNSNYYDKNKKWFALGERYRVIIINKNKVKKIPKKFKKIWNYKKIAISNPFMGTTATHFAALYHKLGEKGFIELLKKIKNSNVVILAGNSVVKDMVAKGKYVVGIVDTDDANVALKHKLPIKIIYYNQTSNGVFGIFSTISIIKNAPHPDLAKKFMKFVLNRKTEKFLIDEGLFKSSVFKNGYRYNIKSWTLNPNIYINDLNKSTGLLRKFL